MPRFLQLSTLDAVIVLLILLETAFIFWFPEELLPRAVNEIGYFLCSVLIGVTIALKYWGENPQYQENRRISYRKRYLLGPVALLTIGAAAFLPFIARAFSETPITLERSDIIPTIAVATRRLLDGKEVYKMLAINGGAQPLTYLPMQWLPYTLAEAFHFDYRWVAIGIFYCASLATVCRCSRASLRRGWVSAVLVIYFLWMILNHNTGVLDSTVELMVGGYYMLLICGIGGKNPWLRGAAITLCLLSRYSLVLWLPLWAFVEWKYVNKKAFYQAVAMVSGLLLALYIIPFLSKDWSAFGRGYAYYTEAAMGEWRNGVIPFQLNQGLGFARMFYLDFSQYPLARRLHLLQAAHLYVCIGSSMIMGIVYSIFHARLHPRIFLLASFKIYLSLFLAFIQVPYTYLMITAVAVSIAIYAEMGRWQVVSDND